MVPLRVDIHRAYDKLDCMLVPTVSELDWLYDISNQRHREGGSVNESVNISNICWERRLTSKYYFLPSKRTKQEAVDEFSAPEISGSRNADEEEHIELRKVHNYPFIGINRIESHLALHVVVFNAVWKYSRMSPHDQYELLEIFSENVARHDSQASQTFVVAEFFNKLAHLCLHIWKLKPLHERMVRKHG